LERQKIVISGINMVEGGIYTILHNALQELSKYSKEVPLEIIAFVPKKSGLEFPNIQLIEIPKSKKSWWFRLYYEYFYFYKISKKLKPDIWFSLHDTTPRVVAKKRFVYCHHPTTFYKPTWNDWKFDYKIGLFSLLYDWVFKINIKKNHTVFVQQHWIKEIFEKRFGIDNIQVTQPDFVELTTPIQSIFEVGKVHFLYPSFPRSFKNFEVIFEAIQLLDSKIKEQCQFHFTLEKNKSKYGDYLLDKYGKMERCFFYPYRNYTEMHSLYYSMDCLLFPSKIETWGLPISEAKQFNKPLLLANEPYAKETCGTYEKVSFFNVNDAEKLAQLITDFTTKNITFDGNVASSTTEKSLKNWKELFDYILKS